MIIRDQQGKERLGKMPAELSFDHMIADTLWHPVSFIKRDLFTRLGKYDETLKMVADYDFFLKAVIVNKVTTRHSGVSVAVFNLDGFSSDPRNVELRLKERLINPAVPELKTGMNICDRHDSLTDFQKCAMGCFMEDL